MKKSILKKTVRKFVIISMLLFVGLFIAGEIYFRLAAHTEYGYLSSVHRYDEDLGFTFIPGGEHYLDNDTVKFNKYGYVDDEWSLEKEPSTYRIAMVGSCVLSGVFHIVDTACYNYPNMAEADLRKNGYNVEIMNFGMPGETRSYFTFKSIEKDVLDFKPDLVIMENVFPYARKEYAKDDYLGYQLEYIFTSARSKAQAIMWAERMSDWSFFVTLMDHSWVIKKLALKYQQTHQNDIANFIRFAVKRQISFIDDAVTGFYTMERSIEMTHELMASLGKDSIDFRVLYYKEDGATDSLLVNSFENIALKTDLTEDLYYPYDTHFNNRGQLYLKEKFLDELITIIPDQYKPQYISTNNIPVN
ncbi:MAG: hypothetical protein R8G66_16115 [Cytophagales bacterium]|nr:hypothetical protein [Cytophagales bacterium]